MAIDLILRPPAEHLAKLRVSLAAVRTLLEAEACHAAFHAARALLASAGVAAATHAGTHQLLSEHFVKDGPLPTEVGRGFGHLMSDRSLADDGPPGVIDAEGARIAAGTTARLLGLMLGALPSGEPATAAALAACREQIDRLRAVLAREGGA